MTIQLDTTPRAAPRCSTACASRAFATCSAPTSTRTVCRSPSASRSTTSTRWRRAPSSTRSARSRHGRARPQRGRVPRHPRPRSRLVVLPWDRRFAVAPADLEHHGRPYTHDSRGVLKRQLAAAAELGYRSTSASSPRSTSSQRRRRVDARGSPRPPERADAG